MAVDPNEYQEIHNYLNEISFISQVTWGQISSILYHKTFKKGKHFAVAGNNESDFAIVMDGIFRAYIGTPKGTEYTKTFFTPIHFKTSISFMGAYSALVTSNVNTMNIEALTDSKILVGSYKEWLLLVNENKELSDWSRKFAEIIVVSKEQKELDYVTKDATERYKIFRMQYPEIEALISQYHIAQFLGISATQLSRIRKKMLIEE